MKNQICNLFLTLLFMQSLGYAEQKTPQVPALSKKEMKQDIDFLVRAIKEIDPHIPIRSQVTGVDIYAEIDSLSAQASQLKSFEEFYYLAQQILFLTQDQHNNFQSFYYEDTNTYISPKSIEISEACESLYDKYHPAGAYGVKYIDGNYYIKGDLMYTSNLSEKIFPASAQIVEINRIPIDEYVSKWNRKADNSIRWDFKHQKYYTYRIYPPILTGLSEEYTLTYKYNDSIVSRDRTASGGTIEGQCYRDGRTPSVLHFEELNILYIRTPSMDAEDIPFFKEKIQQYKSKPIKKVVIDIRNNGGGNDLVWMGIISDIIATPIVFNNDLYVRNTPLTLDYIHNMRKEDLELDPSSTMHIGKAEYISVLNDSEDTILHPSSESINYKGPIYVLVNERCFSSSLAFVAFCNRSNDCLLTVGEPTGYIVGRSTTPFFLSLPNSKLIFEIAPTLDATKGKKNIKDYYDHAVNIPVPFTITNTTFEEAYRGKRYGKDFLLHYDPVFRKIVELGSR